MPLLNICGVTSLNTTFFLAFAFLRHEERSDYQWAMNCLLKLLQQEKIKDPKVMLTDRELALINAISDVFPDTQHLLCIWHINKNVLSNCKLLFETKEDWDTFNTMWQRVVYAHTVEASEEAWEVLVKAYETTERSPIPYLRENWIETTIKRKFLACYSNQTMHFGNTVTSMVEGAHHCLKQALGTSTGDMKHVVDEMEKLLRNQRMDFVGRRSISQATIQLQYHRAFLSEIKSQTTPQALDLIILQYKKVAKLQDNEELEPCTGSFKRIYGLPCAHDIQSVLNNNGRLQIHQIDPHWRYKQPDKYSKREEVVNKDDLNEIDPILRIQQPAIGHTRGRPRKSTVFGNQQSSQLRSSRSSQVQSTESSQSRASDVTIGIYTGIGSSRGDLIFWSFWLSRLRLLSQRLRQPNPGISEEPIVTVEMKLKKYLFTRKSR